MRVFVTVGNALVPFDRLLRMVDLALPEDGFSGICQHGVSALRPRGLKAVPFLTRAGFESALRDADVVVCHAGVGAVSSALRAGHRPLVVPRRVHLGEHVNDHQLELCGALEADGRVRVVSTAEELARAMLDGTRDAAWAEPSRDRLEPIARALASLEGNRSRARPWLLRLLALAAPPLERLRR